MNVAMLKCIVDLAGGTIDTIDTKDFFKIYGKTPHNLHELDCLRDKGYVGLLELDDDTEIIVILEKAVDYFKQKKPGHKA